MLMATLFTDIPADIHDDPPETNLKMENNKIHRGEPVFLEEFYTIKNALKYFVPYESEYIYRSSSSKTRSQIYYSLRSGRGVNCTFDYNDLINQWIVSDRNEFIGENSFVRHETNGSAHFSLSPSMLDDECIKTNSITRTIGGFIAMKNNQIVIKDIQPLAVIVVETAPGVIEKSLDLNLINNLTFNRVARSAFNYLSQAEQRDYKDADGFVPEKARALNVALFHQRYDPPLKKITQLEAVAPAWEKPYLQVAALNIRRVGDIEKMRSDKVLLKSYDAEFVKLLDSFKNQPFQPWVWMHRLDLYLSVNDVENGDKLCREFLASLEPRLRYQWQTAYWYDKNIVCYPGLSDERGPETMDELQRAKLDGKKEKELRDIRATFYLKEAKKIGPEEVEKMKLRLQRADAFDREKRQYFEKTYGIQDSEEFWRREMEALKRHEANQSLQKSDVKKP